jgi:DNA-binding SARP family transcriptional activator
MLTARESWFPWWEPTDGDSVSNLFNSHDGTKVQCSDFRRCHGMLALPQRHERTGHPEEAIALYRAALEQDNLAEELYRHLIECHLARGEQAQALNACRRCRELLSIVLGLKPSARTEALMARISSRWTPT